MTFLGIGGGVTMLVFGIQGALKNDNDNTAL
jgi:hypothetical protein